MAKSSLLVLRSAAVYRLRGHVLAFLPPENAGPRHSSELVLTSGIIRAGLPGSDKWCPDGHHNFHWEINQRAAR